jgi:hypothetical protein
VSLSEGLGVINQRAGHSCVLRIINFAPSINGAGLAANAIKIAFLGKNKKIEKIYFYL